MIPMLEEAKVFNVGDIYKYCNENNLKMLSNYSADFWAPYVDHAAEFDRTFKRRYRSFFPYDQEPGEDIGDVAIDFMQQVAAHLRLNDKRYSELFRVNSILDDDAYSLTNNVDYHEIMEQTSGKEVTFNKGEQKNVTSETDNFDIVKVTEDKETQYGSQEITEDNERGNGARYEKTTNSTSAYNESLLSVTDQSELNTDAVTDTEDLSTTLGSHTDTQDNTITTDAREDSKTINFTDGAREDGTEENGTLDYDIHRIGNMGVQTVDDMLEKHIDVWRLFSFYDFIFAEIANDILRGC